MHIKNYVGSLKTKISLAINRLRKNQCRKITIINNWEADVFLVRATLAGVTLGSSEEEILNEPLPAASCGEYNPKEI